MPAPRLIPEFAPQSGVLLTWPHVASDWRHSLEEIEPVYLELVRAISRHEAVLVVCYDDEHSRHIQQQLTGARVDRSRVRQVAVPSNDTWVRDYGPLAVQDDQSVSLVNFSFDGWGGKYAAGLDNAVSAALAAAGVFSSPGLQQHPLILEGGAIDADGCGSLLTTTRCLLGAGRNPGMDRLALEHALQADLGIDRVLWLDHGFIQGDDTDGHVDMLARFCSPHDIAYTQCRDSGDEHYAALRAMEKQLQSFSDCDGSPYRLHALPLPAPVYSNDGARLPASYANFLIINDAVLLPAYDDPADEEARAVLARCFPGRDIVAVNCLPLIAQYGSLHCASLQLAEGIMGPVAVSAPA
jgi:agmatine deiminase